MATFEWDEYNRRVERARKELKDNRPDDARKMAFDYIVEVKSRVIETGLDKNLNKFSPYSKGWAKVRSDAGRGTLFKNFSWIGTMWKSIIPFVEKNGEVDTVILLTAKDDFSRLKLNANSKREGKSILDPTKAEMDRINDANVERINKVFRKYDLI